MRTMRTPLLVATAMTLALAACDTDDDTAAPEMNGEETDDMDGDMGDDMDDDASGDETIEIVDNDYEPDEIEVSVGDTVGWENTGEVGHTVTFDDEDSGDVEPGDTYSRTFEEAGDFDYLCTIHSTMEAPITVSD